MYKEKYMGKILTYSITGRKATYTFMGRTKTISINPLTPFYSIMTDINRWVS